MPWPTEELKRRFNLPENAGLLRYLEERSPHAHSDLGVLLFDAPKELPGAGLFGPNIAACSYVFAHTRSGVAFVLAAGMRNLILRLGRPHPETEPFPDIGPEWFSLEPFHPDRSRARNAGLVRDLIAAAFARAQGAAR